jgi:predicted MFS family arabinose efflux permease
MATYTLGFQFGSGLGAALWGFVIASSGFALSFVIAAAFQFLLLAIVVRGRASLARPAKP